MRKSSLPIPANLYSINHCRCWPKKYCNSLFSRWYKLIWTKCDTLAERYNICHCLGALVRCKSCDSQKITIRWDNIERNGLSSLSLMLFYFLYSELSWLNCFSFTNTNKGWLEQTSSSRGISPKSMPYPPHCNAFGRSNRKRKTILLNLTNLYTRRKTFIWRSFVFLVFAVIEFVKEPSNLIFVFLFPSLNILFSVFLLYLQVVFPMIKIVIANAIPMDLTKTFVNVHELHPYQVSEKYLCEFHFDRDKVG